LTGLVTLDNPKGTIPYVIFIGVKIYQKDIRSLSIYYIEWILIPARLKIMAYHILWSEKEGESEDLQGKSIVDLEPKKTGLQVIVLTTVLMLSPENFFWKSPPYFYFSS
jgi:hypothetical protein